MSIDVPAIREMQPSDYASVHVLWGESENIGLNESDEESAIAAFLARNPGLSSVAVAHDGRVVGALLCGHDGRRGYLHHLAVAQAFRGRGLGRALVDFAVRGLRGAGITKCNLFIYADSHDARAFWEHLGWRHPDWQVMQRRISGCNDAHAGTC